MTKHFIIILVLLYGFINAQSRSIELPDFVITGSKSISLPEQKKSAPQVIADLSIENIESRDNFENIPSPKFSQPELLTNFEDTLPKFKSGKLKVGSGYYTQPDGELAFSSGIEHVLFNLNLYGKNIRDYEKYSGYNLSGVDGKLNFFISPKSVILPGTKFNFNGKYLKQEYRLFGSDIPSKIRKNDISGTYLSFENAYSNYINYSVNFHADKLEMKSDSLQQIDVRIEPNLTIKFSGLKIFTSGEFVTSKVYSNNSDYYSFQKYFAYVELFPIKNVILKIGGNYSSFAFSNYIKMFLQMSYRFNNQFLFEAKFKPYVKYKNHFDFINKNPYYAPDFVNYVAENHKLFSEVTIGYDFERTLQLNASFSFDHIDSLMFIDDYNSLRNHSVATISDVWQMVAKFNASMKLNSFGNIYLQTTWQSLFNQSKVYLPGYPDFSLNFLHDIPLSKSFTLISSLSFNDGIYYNLNSNKRLPSQLNITLTGNYHLTEKLNLFVKLENLINKNYYDFEYYRHKPFDVIAGFEYQW